MISCWNHYFMIFCCFCYHLQQVLSLWKNQCDILVELKHADPDRPKNDKATILTDTIQVLKDLTAEVNRLKAEHASLSEESHEVGLSFCFKICPQDSKAFLLLIVSVYFIFTANSREEWTQRRKDISKIRYWKYQCPVSAESQSRVPMDCNWSFCCHGSSLFISSSYTHPSCSDFGSPIASAFSLLWKPKSSSNS